MAPERDKLTAAYQEVFQALGILDDIRDLVVIWQGDGVVSQAAGGSIRERIDHAKWHLQGITDADREGYRRATVAMKGHGDEPES